MEGIFNALLPIAIQNDISFKDFWDMTYGEIELTIKAKRDKRKQELQEKAMMDYRLADLIGVSCSRLMDSKVKFPELINAYSFLFDEVKQEPKKQSWEDQKRILMQYAEAHNKKRGGN